MKVKKAALGLLNYLPLLFREKILFFYHLGYWPNLKKPASFNEKICKRKVIKSEFPYDYYSDKVRVKEVVAKIIGDDYVVPTLCVMDSIDKKAVDVLNPPYVVKCNHDSGSVRIVRDRSEVDDDFIGYYNSRLKKKPGYYNEYWYENIPPKILIEKFIPPEGVELVPEDYKIHYFSASDKMFFQVIRGRFSNITSDIYNENGELLAVARNFARGYKELPHDFPLQELATIVRQLANTLEIDYARYDFYINNGRVYFGEITFAPAGGFGAFTPKEVDHEWGRYW